jgi:hypothetical protein
MAKASFLSGFWDLFQKTLHVIDRPGDRYLCTVTWVKKCRLNQKKEIGTAIRAFLSIIKWNIPLRANAPA